MSWQRSPTPRGRMQYERMAMGWCGASDVFNERMEMALKGVPNTSRVVKDVLIFSDDWGSHLKHVTAVLEAFDRHNIAVNVAKIQFGKKAVKFGGSADRGPVSN